MVHRLFLVLLILAAPTWAADVDLLLGQAGGLIQQGRNAEAVVLLDQALTATPDVGPVHALLGEALSLEQHHQRAAEHLRRAVALGHTAPKTIFYLAAAEWEVGNFGEAERLYRLAVERTAGRDFLWVHQLGRVLVWQGKSTEAVDYLRRAVELDPTALDAHLELARALDAAGRDEDAAVAYQRVVELAPGHSHAHYGLAQVLARLGRRDEARRELEVYRELYAHSQEILRRRSVEQARLDQAWQLLRQGDAEAALEHFRALPESPASLKGVAASHAGRGDHAAAVDVLERAVLLAPEDKNLQVLLSRERLAAREDE